MPISRIKIREPSFCSIVEYTVSDEHFHLIFLFRFLILRSGVFRMDLVPAALCVVASGGYYYYATMDERPTQPPSKQARCDVGIYGLKRLNFWRAKIKTKV